MESKLYIFGAHSRARTLKEYIENVYPDTKVQAFLVDNDEPNPAEADGIPVIHLDERGEQNALDRLDRSFPVYLGMKSVNHGQPTSHLKKLGFEKIIPMTVEMDTELRNRYLFKVFHEAGEAFLKLESFGGMSSAVVSDELAKRMRIYVASSVFDGQLKEAHSFHDFEQVIQVGCALTDKRLVNAVYDNNGESISEKNAQFCELTALYWIWKNAKDDYAGLEHYRRFFVLPEDIVDVMERNEIGVILPVPLYVAPNVAENYRSRHVEKVWNDMMDILQERHPEDGKAAETFFAQGLYSPCNMLIARKDIYDGMCEWMFPILFEVVKRNGTQTDRYQNRYPGFLSERLMSFYFWRHRADIKLVYADKVFLQ
ncbi:MAG: DUF4422 domain-containing protein [Lachnospiraceae bacterium]|nr:DUF4422 domain-containing protein [Lachnospiraceae bacterium]